MFEEYMRGERFLRGDGKHRGYFIGWQIYAYLMERDAVFCCMTVHRRIQ